MIKAETLVGDVWEGSFYFETWCDMITLLYNNSFQQFLPSQMEEWKKELDKWITQQNL